MIALTKKSNTPFYVPDYMAQSIEDIDFVSLAKSGIKYIAFDADSTLVPYRGIELAKSTELFLRTQKNLFKDWIVASNRVTNDLHGIAEALGAQVERATLLRRKPRKAFFRRVLKRLDARPHEVAMIGDKIFADVWGANRMGIKSVWVEHLGKDSFLDRSRGLRATEKRILKRYL